MNYKTGLATATHLSSAINSIERNNSSTYQWYPVINKKGSLIEVGGTSNIIKAYIPKCENGKIQVYSNGYADSEFSISSNGEIAFPTFYMSHKMTKEKFIDFLDNTDFKVYKLNYIEEEEEVITTVLHRRFLG